MKTASPALRGILLAHGVLALCVISASSLAAAQEWKGNTSDPICRRQESAAASKLPPGTQRMVERLTRIREAAEAEPTVYQPELQAIQCQQQLDEAMASDNRPLAMILRPRLAMLLLNAGESGAALLHFQRYKAEANAAGWRLDAVQTRDLAIQMAVCHLRIAEQENCLEFHNPESCLIPIQPGGVHRQTRGATGAIGVLTRYLQQNPQDLQARWLLNIAYMVLGRHPASQDIQGKSVQSLE